MAWLLGFLEQLIQIYYIYIDIDIVRPLGTELDGHANHLGKPSGF